MQPLLSREQARAFDQHAIERQRVASLILMENAGRGAWECIARRIGPRERIVVVCGRGNNGGDGFVVARHAHCLGHDVGVVLVARLSETSPDARVNAEAWLGLGGTLYESPDAGPTLSEALADATVVVDALLGTGLSRAVGGAALGAIEALNAARARLFALDVPSGLDADTGRPLDVAVRAEVTLTFAHNKLGLALATSKPFSGEVEVVGIGVPPTLPPHVTARGALSEPSDVRALLLQRPRPRHKGEAGQVLILAGALGTLGAARLAAHGALRTGAGLVKVATFGQAARELGAGNWEAMTAELDPADPDTSLAPLLAWANAVVVGPGFGLGAASVAATRRVICDATGPVVVDADALTHFAGKPEELRVGKRLLLTPHPGEAARLLRVSSSDVERDRLGCLTRLLEASGATVLLKGERTLIGAPGASTICVNPTGTPALATGGSGDVLSGVLGALCCHLPPEQAAIAGAWLHGRAAELWSERGGARGMLAREIADELPRAMAELTEGSPATARADRR